MDTSMTMRSNIRFCCTAATIPSGIPTASATVIAISASLADIGSVRPMISSMFCVGYL